MRKKAAEELKKEQERKAAERRRIIEERCGKPKNVEDANEGIFNVKKSVKSSIVGFILPFNFNNYYYYDYYYDYDLLLFTYPTPHFTFIIILRKIYQHTTRFLP